MKANINKDGILEIRAETELEAFALKVWNDMNWEKFSGAGLSLSWDIDDIKKNNRSLVDEKKAPSSGICPECGSEDIRLVEGTFLYKCHNCGWIKVVGE